MARIREYEELIDLQDKAIEALKQALAAMAIALNTIERARNEHGYPQKFDFGSQPDQVYALTKYYTKPNSYDAYGLGGAVGGLGVYNNGMSVSQANTQASNLSAVEQMYYQKKLAESAQFMLEP